MDTPQRNLIGKKLCEESPVFNYLSNLSPIKHVKSIHTSQSFTSLNLTSPSSLFTSPHVVSSLKDSTFLKRHIFSDQSRTDDTDKGTKDSSTEIFLGSCQVGENVFKEDIGLEHPATEVSTNHGEQSEVPKVFPWTLEYDYGKPACESMSEVFTEQHDGCSVEASHSRAFQGVSKESSDQSDGVPQNTPHREMSRLHWYNLATDARDSLFMDSPNETIEFRGLFDKTPGTGENPSSLASLFLDNINELQLAQPICQVDSSGVDMDQEASALEDIQPQYSDWAPESIPCSVQEGTHKHSYSVADIAGQLASNSHQGVRRRCLTFETFGGHSKSLSNVANNLPRVPLQAEEMETSRFEQSIISKPVSTFSSKPAKDGIGLHLNALATAKDKHISLSQNLPPGVEINVSSSTNPSSPATFQESLHKPLRTASYLKDASPLRTDAQASEDDSPAIAHSEELNSISPRKKRPRLANAGDESSCKRCNCKKSKCLKLYCECFAAGVYCIEPCSCQDCYNKPIHEETVLATRKQIETRNPLAFAPKVVPASQATPYVEDEMANTPASARHRRGCNCKKSSCLKKYCECYQVFVGHVYSCLHIRNLLPYNTPFLLQGGVGCSLNCRCESCKNTYGRKDGLEIDLEVEAVPKEEEQPTEKSFVDRGLQKAAVRMNEEKIMDPSFPTVASRLSRLSVKLQFPSKGKPMRSSFRSKELSAGSQNDSKGMKLSSTPLPPKYMPTTPAEEMRELLQNQGSPRNIIKINSPNSKRVSPPQCMSTPSSSRTTTRKLILQAIPSFPSLK
ncbi:hypothetical protein QQ045_006881 [Rhodiola kirilowii]